MGEDAGLYTKFQVYRVDGRDSMPYDKHFGCQYFVLDLTHDPYALHAIIAYAAACKNTHPKLSKDLVERALEMLNETNDSRGEAS